MAELSGKRAKDTGGFAEASAVRLVRYLSTVYSELQHQGVSPQIWW